MRRMVRGIKGHCVAVLTSFISLWNAVLNPSPRETISVMMPEVLLAEHWGRGEGLGVAVGSAGSSPD